MATSVGASGALFGLLGIYASLFPDNMLQFLFLDQYPFSAESGIKGLMAFDALGMLFRWAFLDHACHLGGAMFGIWWITQGHKLMEPIVKWWHKNRHEFVKPNGPW